MKVYFTASARGVKEYGNYYQQIYESLENLGYEHVDDSIGRIDDNFYSGTHDDKVKEYNLAVKSIKESDIVVLEVSTHSLSMGYVLQRALDMNRPVICLHVVDKVPAFATVIDNEKLQVLEYSKHNLKQVIEEAVDYAKDQSDTRFNFFISSRHSQYLDWIAKNRRIPRSVYLRNLIKSDMQKNSEYNQ